MTDTTQTPPNARQDPPYWFPDTRTAIVIWMMVSTFVLVVLCWWKPPSADNQILNTLIGIYGATGFVTALTWWMGSSKGSDDKSAAINKQLTTSTEK